MARIGGRRLVAATGGLLLLGLVGSTVASAANLLSPPKAYPVPGGAALSVITGDFTGDGRRDVAVTVANYGPDVVNDLLLYVQTASGNLAAPVGLATSAIGPVDRMGLSAGDLDGDGKTDLVVTTALGVDLFRQGSGTLVPAGRIDLPGASDVEILDVDLDGKADIVVSAAPGTLFLRGTGGGAFAIAVQIVENLGVFEVGDVTGDGWPDVAGLSGANLAVHRQIAGTNFAPAVLYTVSTGFPPLNLTSMAIGDVTSDGRADISVSTGGNGPNSTVKVFTQTAAGILTGPTTYPALDSAAGLVAADVNGDGATDLAVAHPGFSNVGVFAQREGGTLAPERLTNVENVGFVPGGTPLMDVADVTGDGLADAVVPGEGGLAVLRGATGKTHDVPFTQWAIPSATPLDGIGTWIATANDPLPDVGQQPQYYAYAHILGFESHQTVMIALSTDPNGKFASFVIFDLDGTPRSSVISFPWLANRLYFPFVYRLAPGVWGAWIYDQSEERWVSLGAFEVPLEWGKLQPGSFTLVLPYGPEAWDCSVFPLVDVLYHPPIGLVEGQAIVGTSVGSGVLPGTCASQTTTEHGVWARYRLGADAVAPPP